MFTFFKRSSKHKYDDSRSASATPPPSSSRLPSPSLLLSTAAGGERKAPKNKRVRFKFVSDHHHHHREEDEPSPPPQHYEEPVSVLRSNQLHGSGETAPFDHWQRDSTPHYSVEEPWSPTDEQQHVFQNGRVEEQPQEEHENCPRKPRSALNQLLDRMGGKKNRHRGFTGGGNSKKAKQESVHQQAQRFIPSFNLQNVDAAKKCDQDEEVEESDIYYDKREQRARGGDSTFGTHQETGPGSGRAHQENILNNNDGGDAGGYGDGGARVGEAADTDAHDGIGEITEVAAGKATPPPFNFNARGDEMHENRPVEVSHKITTEQSDELSQQQQQQQNKKREDQPIFRLFVNEQPTIAEEPSSPPGAAQQQEVEVNPAADFVRDLVLNRYKKKREHRPIVYRGVDQDVIPTVIRTVPVVVEKSDDEEEEQEQAKLKKMGQPNSKASSPNPLEKSSSDGSIHPAVIITEEEVFYEASAEPEIVHGVVEDDQDGSILRVHSPLTIGGVFKTIHVSTEDLQDELEKEDSETEDSGNYNGGSVYQNTLKNKSGVTVTEILDENSHDGISSTEDEEEEDSGCEGTLGSVSPQMRPSPVPIVVVETVENGTKEENGDSEEDAEIHRRDTMNARKKMRLEERDSVHHLPDVVESIGLPNVLHHNNVSVKFAPSSESASEKQNMVPNQQSQGVLHVDGNSQRSSLIRNIPITILEEVSEEEEAAEEEQEEPPRESEVKFNGASVINNNNKSYKLANGLPPVKEISNDSNGFDWDK